MKKKIIFSGIAFEAGQSKMGLQLSAQVARTYFGQLKTFDFIDNNDVIESFDHQKVKLFSEKDLERLDQRHFETAYNKTKNLLSDSNLLLNWGGDHSIALSTVSAFLEHYPKGHVIWIDAHADINLPSASLTGNFHGMPLSLLLNIDGISSRNCPWIKNYLDPKKLIYIGLRDIDDFENKLIQKLGILAFTNDIIKEIGITKIIQYLSAILKYKDVHISFDIDSVDPRYAPSTGIPVKSGLTSYELNLLASLTFNESRIRSLDIVEINPCLGTQAQIDKTYHVAFQFLESLINKTIQGESNDQLGKRNKANDSFKMEWSS